MVSKGWDPEGHGDEPWGWVGVEGMLGAAARGIDGAQSVAPWHGTALGADGCNHGVKKCCGVLGVML